MPIKPILKDNLLNFLDTSSNKKYFPLYTALLTDEIILGSTPPKPPCWLPPPPKPPRFPNPPKFPKGLFWFWFWFWLLLLFWFWFWSWLLLVLWFYWEVDEVEVVVFDWTYFKGIIKVKNDYSPFFGVFQTSSLGHQKGSSYHMKSTLILNLDIRKNIGVLEDLAYWGWGRIIVRVE